MWDDFIPRVDKICEFYGIKKVELAEIIGTAQSNLSTHGVHHKEAYRILVNFPDINARWLLFGEGDMLTRKETDPHSQADPAPEGVTILDKEGQVYKYLYEMKDKECQSLTRTFAEEIGKLKRDNDHLTAKLRELSVKPYRIDDEGDLPMAAESTD
jgi:hypothetical protein